MKTGIIGLPQVGKSSLFRMLTKAQVSERAYANPREAHVGVAKVPDDRLDRLAAMCNPRKLIHASVEYVDVAAMPVASSKTAAGPKEGLSESIVTNIRGVDAIAHVVRAFDDPSIPHVGEINPLRDIKNVDFDLILSDLGQIEKRMERLQKDLKKMRSPELEREHDLLLRAKAHLESELPLREMPMTPEDKKRVRGFMFLSEKPILYVLNISESSDLGRELEAAIAKHGLAEVAARPNAGASAICGKVEAELAEMADEDAAEFLASYGLQESGLVRLVRKTYELLGLISFFTVGRTNAAPGPSPATPARWRQLGPSTPTWKSTLFALKQSVGMRCWRPAPRPTPAPAAPCAWKARTTLCRMGMSCTSAIRGRSHCRCLVPLLTVVALTRYRVLGTCYWLLLFFRVQVPTTET